jgi:mRNA interferase RelE/StbE
MAGKPVQVLQTAAFARAYKKLQKNQKADVDDAVDAILKTPEQGEVKRGDLLGVDVYKFRSNNQLMLLACAWDPETRLLLLLGSHENFYRDIKR